MEDASAISHVTSAYSDWFLRSYRLKRKTMSFAKPISMRVEDTSKTYMASKDRPVYVYFSRVPI